MNSATFADAVNATPTHSDRELHSPKGAREFLDVSMAQERRKAIATATLGEAVGADISRLVKAGATPDFILDMQRKDEELEVTRQKITELEAQAAKQSDKLGKVIAVGSVAALYACFFSYAGGVGQGVKFVKAMGLVDKARFLFSK